MNSDVQSWVLLQIEELGMGSFFCSFFWHWHWHLHLHSHCIIVNALLHLVYEPTNLYLIPSCLLYR
jgi:hypothetical protein